MIHTKKQSSGSNAKHSAYKGTKLFATGTEGATGNIVAKPKVFDRAKGTFVKPTYEEVGGKLTPIFELLSFTTKGRKHTAKRAIAFASITRAALRDADGLIYWISKKESWNEEKYPVSYNCFKTVTKAMEAKGWLSLPRGQTAKDGHSRRWQVSQSLLDLVAGLSLDWVDIKPKRERRKNLVEVRQSRLRKDLKARGYRLPVFDIDKDAVAKLTEDMRQLNAMMQQHRFEGLVDPNGEPFIFSGLYRVFNHTLRRGGRLYGGVEQTPKVLRKHVRIDGSAVVEIDIRCSHPNLLFGLSLQSSLPFEEAPVGQDFYQIASDKLAGLLTRDEVKEIVNRAIGKGELSASRWPRGFRKDKVSWKEEVLPTILQVMPFLNYLEPLKMDGLRLQAIEADILISTMEGLYRHRGIPVLPIHDALLCREQDVDAVTNALKLSFWFKAGVCPLLHTKWL